MTQIVQALGATICRSMRFDIRHNSAAFGVLSGVSTGYVAIEFPAFGRRVPASGSLTL
jgi:hypothetical protein